MRSSALVVFVSIVLAENLYVYSLFPKICKSAKGIIGRCVPPNYCSKSLSIETYGLHCASSDKICCKTEVSEKIVTDDSGLNQPVPVPAPIPTLPPVPATQPPAITTAPVTVPPTMPPATASPATLPPATSVPSTLPPATASPPMVPTVPTITPNPFPPNTPAPIQNEPLYKKKCEEYSTSVVFKADTPKVYIIGGSNSAAKEFPHMAALGFGDENDKQWLCGGSLISERYVVTAAHCIYSNILGEVKYVKLGTNNINDVGDEFRVTSTITHPGFSRPSQYNDIGLIQLDKAAVFSETVRPICLENINDLSAERLIATGWGKMDFNGNSSPLLQKVDLEYFNNAACQQAYEKISKDQLSRGIDDANQVCAGSRSGQKDTCQGDSGGPLQINKRGRLYLVGLTSFGIGCGTANVPGVYTRISSYIPWIENAVWK